jgi:hypothetical protein
VGRLEWLGERLNGVWYNNNFEDEVLSNVDVDLLLVWLWDPPNKDYRSGPVGLMLRKTQFKGSGHVPKYRRQGLFRLYYGSSAEEIERWKLQHPLISSAELFDTCEAQTVEII